MRTIPWMRCAALVLAACLCAAPALAVDDQILTATPEPITYPVTEPPPLEGGLTVEVQPGPDDLSQEKAEADARRGVALGFGIPMDRLQTEYRVESALYAFPDAPESAFWRVAFYPVTDAPDLEPKFFVEMSARTGEQYMCLDWRESAQTGAIAAWLTRLRGIELLWGPSGRWTLEQQASFDAWAVEIGYYVSDIGTSVLPGPDDLPLEEALRLAKQAIADKYGWSEDRFERYDAYPSLWKDSDIVRRWAINFRPKPGVAEEAEGVFYVWVTSPSGIVLEIAAEKESNG